MLPTSQGWQRAHSWTSFGCSCWPTLRGARPAGHGLRWVWLEDGASSRLFPKHSPASFCVSSGTSEPLDLIPLETKAHNTASTFPQMKEMDALVSGSEIPKPFLLLQSSPFFSPCSCPEQGETDPVFGAVSAAT